MLRTRSCPSSAVSRRYTCGMGAKTQRALNLRGGYGGKSLLEKLEEELDVVIDRLMAGEPAEDDKGYAKGLTFSIATIRGGYGTPNVEAVKTEAMERYDARA